MPRIAVISQEVSAQANLPGRRADAADFGTAGLSALGQGISEVASALREKEEANELSEVKVRLAETKARAQTKLREALLKADPGDAEFAAKLNTSFAEELDKGSQGLNTKKGRLAYSQGSRVLQADLLQDAMVGQSGLAGQKAKTDHVRRLNASQQIVMTSPDDLRSTVADLVGDIQGGAGWYGKLPQPARDELAQQAQVALSRSAVQGLIERDPQEARAKLLSGSLDDLLDADEKKQLINAADISIRADEADTERALRLAEREQKAAQQATADDLVQRIYTGEKIPTAKEIVQSNLDPAQKEHYVKLMQESLKEAPQLKTDPALLIALWERIHLPDGHPEKLLDENRLDKFFGYGLSREDILSLRTEIQGKRTAEGDVEGTLKKALADQARSVITRTNSFTGIRDPKGDANYYKFLSFLLPEYQRQRQAGKTAVQLLTPDSPDYVGKAIAQYVRPLEQQLKDIVEGFAAPAVETPFVKNAVQKFMDVSGKTVYQQPDGTFRYADGTEYRP